MVNKPTLVIGASLKAERYSNIAIKRLVDNGVPVVAFGLRSGVISGIPIQTKFDDFSKVHTVTLYIGPKHQPEYYQRIIALNAQRVIFNPGTENPEFYEILKKNGIKVEVACTLVLLATKQY